MSEPVAVRRGREQRKRERRAAAIKRVVAFTKYLKRGCPTGQCPPIPSNADYRIYRGEKG